MGQRSQHWHTPSFISYQARAREREKEEERVREKNDGTSTNE